MKPGFPELLILMFKKLESTISVMESAPPLVEPCAPQLYPELPTPETIEETPSALHDVTPDSTNQNKARQSLTDAMRPLSDAQLTSLYYNGQLRASLEFIEAFNQVRQPLCPLT